MKKEQFDDIISWKKSQELSLTVSHTFENSNDFEFKNQIEHVAVSVMNNIAEGFEKIYNLSEEISKLLSGLIKAIK